VQLGHEVAVAVDHEPPRVSRPPGGDPLVDQGGLGGGLDPELGRHVSMIERRRPQVDQRRRGA
jgi:hypothetical protein